MSAQDIACAEVACYKLDGFFDGMGYNRLLEHFMSDFTAEQEVEMLRYFCQYDDRIFQEALKIYENGRFSYDKNGKLHDKENDSDIESDSE